MPMRQRKTAPLPTRTEERSAVFPFIAMHGGDEKGPFVVVTMTRHSDDSDEQRHFNHTFFEHGSMVYHLWLDCDLLDGEETHEITSTVFPE